MATTICHQGLSEFRSGFVGRCGKRSNSLPELPGKRALLDPNPDPAYWELLHNILIQIGHGWVDNQKKPGEPFSCMEEQFLQFHKLSEHLRLMNQDKIKVLIAENAAVFPESWVKSSIEPLQENVGMVDGFLETYCSQTLDGHDVMDVDRIEQVRAGIKCFTVVYDGYEYVKSGTQLGQCLEYLNGVASEVERELLRWQVIMGHSNIRSRPSGWNAKM